MAARLLPWLGMASVGRQNLGNDRTNEDVLDDLILALADAVAENPSLRQRVVDLLDARNAPARHRAARVLIAQPGGPQPDLLPRLRGLLDDRRSEFRWPERLQVAELFLNHQDYALSQRAIATALDALDYGHDPWYCYWNWEPLYPPAIRSRAATILGRLDPLHPDPVAFARLAQVLVEDEDENVRDAAYGALLRLAAARPAEAAHT
jgi:HEAT repeat protein